MLIITNETKLPRDFTFAHLSWIFGKYGGNDEPFLEHCILPAHVPPLSCALHGPMFGDMIEASDTRMLTLHDQPWKSRVVLNRRPRHTRMVSLSGTCLARPGAGADDVITLLSVVAGPPRPPEPGDPACAPSERTASELFWSSHALAFTSEHACFFCMGCGAQSDTRSLLKHEPSCNADSRDAQLWGGPQ